MHGERAWGIAGAKRVGAARTRPHQGPTTCGHPRQWFVGMLVHTDKGGNTSLSDCWHSPRDQSGHVQLYCWFAPRGVTLLAPLLERTGAALAYMGSNGLHTPYTQVQGRKRQRKGSVLSGTFSSSELYHACSLSSFFSFSSFFACCACVHACVHVREQTGRWAALRTCQHP